MNDFEKELVYFKTRVETIISLEMGDKITMENAYKEIRRLMKKLKKSKKILTTKRRTFEQKILLIYRLNTS